MEPKVYTIAPELAFADTLARGLVARFNPQTDVFALASVTIYLPTRRAARTLIERFAALLGGAALLPAIHALGDSDEDEMPVGADTAGFEIAEAISPLRQRLLLTAMIDRWSAARGQPVGYAQASALAKGLGAFLYEVQTACADLSKLESLAPAAYAAHWAEIREFLLLLRDVWPGMLAAEGTIDPAERRNLTLESLRLQLLRDAPDGPVIAAGSTGSIAATAELLAVIARLPRGAVILPGLDQDLDAASWNGLDEGHPQFGMKRLLDAIEIDRDSVGHWTADATGHGRSVFLREALRPAPTTDAWQELAASPPATLTPREFSLIEAATPAEEARIVALIIRETLQIPERTAALVTPDRGLARRVASELARWDIAIDDSAGRPLSHTPPGEFLCLLADAVEAEFAPVAMLALLKHPLAAGGVAPAEFRAHARALDAALRGPRPDAGLDGIASAIAEKRQSAAWFGKVVAALQPFAQLLQQRRVPLSEAILVHVAAAEALATGDKRPGADILWQGDAGTTSKTFLETLAEAAGGVPDIDAAAYPAFIRSLIAEQTVRPAYGRHPRLAILGPLEARLQRFDVTILGGMNEGSWPRAAQTDAWLSRPMRRALGLEQPERDIGRSAHDFAILAAAPRVILTRALKADGTPAVASRWWQRIVQLASGLGFEAALRDGEHYVAMARVLDRPEARATALERPAPAPPLAVRPRGLSVTEIETWLRDPYAIYAKHVLRLRPLDPLDANLGARERGIAIHAALDRFTREFPDALPEAADIRLVEIAEELFDTLRLPRAARALWRPRFMRAAKWFVAEERARRKDIVRSAVESDGEIVFASAGGEFRLRARADRIDVLKSGGGAIVDYKSGTPPTDKQVLALLTPQLPLEAAMLAGGGFAATGPLTPAELIYIRFSGGAEAGEIRIVKADAMALARSAAEKLQARIVQFDDPHTPYLSRIMPYRSDAEGDYDHLARVREWSLSGWEGEE